jgi:hypothetical protein
MWEPKAGRAEGVPLIVVFVRGKQSWAEVFIEICRFELWEVITECSLELIRELFHGAAMS